MFPAVVAGIRSLLRDAYEGYTRPGSVTGNALMLRKTIMAIQFVVRSRLRGVGMLYAATDSEAPPTVAALTLLTDSRDIVNLTHYQPDGPAPWKFGSVRPCPLLQRPGYHV